MPALSTLVSDEALAAFCRRWEVAELAIFGSGLRADFGPQSDVDLLVSFAPGTRHGLLDMMQMEDELEALFERPVDLMTRRAVEESHNWIRRRAILSSAQPLFRRGGDEQR